MNLLFAKVFLSEDSTANDSLVSAADKAAKGIQDTGIGALPYIVIAALVLCGIALIAFGRRGKEGVKEYAPQLLGGIALILLAIPIANWIMGLF